jgi:hypothetical protein
LSPCRQVQAQANAVTLKAEKEEVDKEKEEKEASDLKKHKAKAKRGRAGDRGSDNYNEEEVENDEEKREEEREDDVRDIFNPDFDITKQLKKDYHYEMSSDSLEMLEERRSRTERFFYRGTAVYKNTESKIAPIAKNDTGARSFMLTEADKGMLTFPAQSQDVINKQMKELMDSNQKRYSITSVSCYSATSKAARKRRTRMVCGTQSSRCTS